MSEQETKRRRVYDHLNAGVSQSNIAKIVEMNVRTVRRIQSNKNSGKGIERASGSGGHNKKRDDAFLECLESKINADPTKRIVSRPEDR